MFTLREPHKASIAERFIRTLKSRIERHFTENNTTTWIDVLQPLSEALNNSVNRSIGVAPNDVNFQNRAKIFKKLYGSRTPPIDCKFELDDIVRIPVKKNIFSKGYAPNWSQELFKIIRKRREGDICFYNVEGTDGVALTRNFYEQELNLVIRNATKKTPEKKNP